jgi:hypothetical protein
MRDFEPQIPRIRTFAPFLSTCKMSLSPARISLLRLFEGIMIVKHDEMMQFAYRARNGPHVLITQDCLIDVTKLD